MVVDYTDEEIARMEVPYHVDDDLDDPSRMPADEKHAYDVAGLLLYTHGLYGYADEVIQYQGLQTPIDLETGEPASKIVPRQALNTVKWSKEIMSDGSTMITPLDETMKKRLESHSDVTKRHIGSLALGDLGILAWPSKFSKNDDGSFTSTETKRRSVIYMCSNGKFGKSIYRVAVKDIAKYSHWTLASSSKTAPFIAVDVDKEDAMVRYLMAAKKGLVPPCSWIIENHMNGHAQIFWAIPAIRREHERAMKLYDAVKAVLCMSLQGDVCFVDRRCQSPYWYRIGQDWKKVEHDVSEFEDTTWDVYLPGSKGGYRRWSLDAIKDFLVSHGAWDPAEGFKYVHGEHEDLTPYDTEYRIPPSFVRDKIDDESGVDKATGRMKAINPETIPNHSIQEGEREVKLFLMATWVAWHRSRVQDFRYIDVYALNINKMSTPLPQSEVRKVAKSVKRYLKKHWDKKKAHQKNESAVEMGRKGGLKNSIRQQVARVHCLYAGNLERERKGRRTATAMWSKVVLEGKTKSQASKEIGVSPSGGKKALQRAYDRVRDYLVLKTAGEIGWPEEQVALFSRIGRSARVLTAMTTAIVIRAARSGQLDDDEIKKTVSRSKSLLGIIAIANRSRMISKGLIADGRFSKTASTVRLPKLVYRRPDTSADAIMRLPGEVHKDTNADVRLLTSIASLIDARSFDGLNAAQCVKACLSRWSTREMIARIENACTIALKQGEDHEEAINVDAMVSIKGMIDLDWAGLARPAEEIGAADTSNPVLVGDTGWVRSTERSYQRFWEDKEDL